MVSYLNENSGDLKQVTSIAIIILIFVVILLFLYLFTIFRKVKIILSKVNYLVEDITYKSEMMNSTVETIVKISNYVDTFEAISKKNVKSISKLIIRNRDYAYKLFDKIKEYANSEPDKNKTKKKYTTKEHSYNKK